ncbi:MAG: hypothetical protein AB8E15_06415 [Bdellovibrionales bacterium]
MNYPVFFLILLFSSFSLGCEEAKIGTLTLSVDSKTSRVYDWMPYFGVFDYVKITSSPKHDSSDKISGTAYLELAFRNLNFITESFDNEEFHFARADIPSVNRAEEVKLKFQNNSLEPKTYQIYLGKCR